MGTPDYRRLSFTNPMIYLGFAGVWVLGFIFGRGPRAIAQKIRNRGKKAG